MRAGSLRGAPLIINGPIEYRALRHAKHNAFFVSSACHQSAHENSFVGNPYYISFSVEQSANTKTDLPLVSLIVSCHLGRLGEYWWYSARSQSQEI